MLVESDLSAMKMIFAVVTEKAVFVSVKRESALCNAVADSAHDCAEISVGTQIAFQCVISADNAYLARGSSVEPYICNGRAEIEYLHGHPAALESINGNGSAIRRNAERIMPYIMFHISLTVAVGIHRLPMV